MSHPDHDGARRHAAELLRSKLDERCTYHNLGHTESVAAAAETFARAEGLDEEGENLLVTAAWWHDLGFIERYQDNEIVAAEMARKHLPDYGFSPAQAERVAELIMATRMPQTPADHLAALMCDADLHYLGTDEYVFWGGRLRKEFENLGTTMDDSSWLAFQRDFIKKHKYFTPVAQRLRDAGKARNLAGLDDRM